MVVPGGEQLGLEAVVHLGSVAGVPACEGVQTSKLILTLTEACWVTSLTSDSPSVTYEW